MSGKAKKRAYNGDDFKREIEGFFHNGKTRRRGFFGVGFMGSVLVLVSKAKRKGRAIGGAKAVRRWTGDI